MKPQIDSICKKHDVALCYVFGSQEKTAKALLEGQTVKMIDFASDIDFAVLFRRHPKESLEAYTLLSLDLQDLVSPFRADLLFLHEVDHLIQLEAIKGTSIYEMDEASREAYEEKVMMFAADEFEIFKLNEVDLLEAIQDGYFEFEYQVD